MYSVVVAFGLASVMLCIGMAIRAKVKFFQHMLMPVSVIGGILGFILMNLVLSKYPVGGVSVTDFSNIVDVFFVMSFISIGLTGSKKKKNKKTEDGKKKKSSGPVRGAIGMALIWCILYALQPLVGILIVSITGKAFHMDSMYGILVPFAFCQGPGQASTYGRLFEYTYGFDKADDDDKIRLNQRKPSKYKGLSRFGPEKNLQRINKFMKERPTFYKKLIQMKENFRFYLRCFYCITKVVILQFNSEKQDRISS